MGAGLAQFFSILSQPTHSLLWKSKNIDVITVVSQLTVTTMNAINILDVVFRQSPPVKF